MIAAILRAPVYSPNHIGIDADILNHTVEHLRRRGCRVRTLSEEQLISSGDISEKVVIHMCRNPRSLEILAAKADRGDIVVNSPQAVENCTRERLTRIFLGSGIPYPQSLIVDTDRNIIPSVEAASISAAWIKRGDLFPQHKEDITFVRTPAQAQQIVQEYFLRGIKRAVISRHVPGRLIQFYGILSAGFFRWFAADGLEVPEGTDKRMRAIATEAAETLEIDIYGGQAILSPLADTLTIVDFNDFPSFAPISDEASLAIARSLLARIKNT